MGQLFHDVSGTAGIIHLKARNWGNPIWGDLNNDGYLDLIVSGHKLDCFGGPSTLFVYRNWRASNLLRTRVKKPSAKTMVAITSGRRTARLLAELPA